MSLLLEDKDFRDHGRHCDDFEQRKSSALMVEEKLPKLDFGEVVCLYIPRATVKANSDFMLFSPKVVCLLEPNPFAR